MRTAFGGKNNTEIAKKLKITPTAVGNYVKGKITLPAIVEISKSTGYSVDWLLTGEGDTHLNSSKTVNLDETFRTVVREIVREEITESSDLNEKIQSVFLAMQSNVESFKPVEVLQKEKKAQ